MCDVQGKTLDRVWGKPWMCEMGDTSCEDRGALGVVAGLVAGPGLAASHAERTPNAVTSCYASTYTTDAGLFGSATTTVAARIPVCWGAEDHYR